MARILTACADRDGKTLLLTFLVIVVISAPALSGDSSRAVDFNRDIRPILSGRCFVCHGPDEAERMGGGEHGLRLDTREGALEDLGGYAAVVPGDPDASELLGRVKSDDEYERMPPADSGKSLGVDEIELLARWVKEGASYAQHWSYVKPARPPLPEVKSADWPRNGIDRFILARLEREGLEPSAEADRYTLIRRLSLDLTGLPPTVEEADAFVADIGAEAYERLVDRLLASPAYGEHWACKWLDLARYADSAGYADDPPRTIWAFRDWVIRAINANMPFDRFTAEQIAGDLLPDPTEDQLIATAFHRNTPTNSEGGTNDEEFRNVAVVDRVNTTMAVWMGTTMACAQCHTHKYDPITQEEYFRFFAIFNNTEDTDKNEESPTLASFTEEQQQRRERLQEQIAAAEKDPAELKKQLEGIQPLTTPIMRELAGDKRRKTHVQHRGNYQDLGPEVAPGVPAVFQPAGAERVTDRTSLAAWLVDEENPLTARVAVNRCWEQIFGIGLVRTSEDFGTQGDEPSHPELLDWLATEFVCSGWDQKALVRLLVTSAAYRQSSRATDALLEIDPDNRLLARGPRFRTPAEVVRDQALFAGSLLSEKMFGPPVRPPQPSLGLKAAFGSAIDWQTSEGEDRYRRAIYTTWRRSNPYPSMATFGAPNRALCTIRRPLTNTPLQALVTLNDPVFMEAAQALARSMKQHDGGVEAKVRYGFRRCLTRSPQEPETVALVGLYEAAHERYSADREAARLMATDPLGPAGEGADLAALAAWTAVGNVLLNLDELLMKR